MIVDFSKFKVIDIDKTVKADWNYKADDDDLLIKLIENLKRNGQIENIIVRQLDTGFYEVVNGNHRIDAFKKLGQLKIVVYDLGNISLAEAQRIALETNETQFQVDQIKLAQIIKDITTEYPLEELALSLPFSSEELDNYIKMIEFDNSKHSNNNINSEDKKVTTEENEIHLTLSEDILKKWLTWKNKCSKGSETLLSDYDCFILAVNKALQE